jgi:hypothetical protein
MRTSILAAFLTVTTAASFSAISKADDLGKQFQSEYAVAWKRTEEVYSKIVLTEEFQTPYRIRDGKKPITISYMGDGARYRMDMETPEIGMRVSVATPTLSFRLEKPLGQTEFIVKDINRHAFSEIRQGMRERGCLPFAPFSIMDTRLIDIVSQPTFEKVSHEVVMVEGKELLRLNWRDPYTDEEGKLKTRVGWFLFLPRCWVLREYKFAYDETSFGSLRARIEYDGELNGIPLVKSIEQWAERRDGSTEPRMTSRIVHLSTTPPASESFTLAAFNLPNGLGEAAKPQTSRLWMILLGLSGLAVSWLLAAWIRKRHSASTS